MGYPPHKFKRKPIYGHVKVDMSDNNFNGIEKIEEEAESLVQTPHDINNDKDGSRLQQSP